MLKVRLLPWTTDTVPLGAMRPPAFAVATTWSVFGAVTDPSPDFRAVQNEASS